MILQDERRKDKYGRAKHSSLDRTDAVLKIWTRPETIDDGEFFIGKQKGRLPELRSSRYVIFSDSEHFPVTIEDISFVFFSYVCVYFLNLC
jgi:hypothetical protein